jgi:nucleoside-diphosphate-sugar epimerase
MASVGILGATGFLGGAIYSHLSDSCNHEVFGCSRQSKKYWRFDYQNLSLLDNFDLIVNCAGPSSETCSMRPQDAYEYYDVFQNRLLDYCLKKNKKLISLSTVHVYKLGLHIIAENSGWAEGSAYTKYRRDFENRMIQEGTGSTILLRLGNCFGVSGSRSLQEEKLFINSIALSFKAHKKYQINSTVDFFRSYVPIIYLIKILVALIDSSKFCIPVMNVVSKEPTSAREIIDIFHRVTGKEFIEFSFRTKGHQQKISNNLCSKYSKYNDNYFLKEIEGLLK